MVSVPPLVVREVWSGREVRAWARGDRLARGHDCGPALKKSDGFAAQPVTRTEAVAGRTGALTRPVSGEASRGDLDCRLIFAQSFVDDLAQQIVFRPGQVFDLGDKFRPHPMHAA